MDLTQAILRMYKAAGMDEHGMLPKGLRCKRCGRALDADGNHPAERYAGTYTGLCDDCTRAPVFMVEEDPTDGARKLSYPPQCPSWRREREEVVAYADCPACQGTGRVQETVYQWSGWRETIMAQCKACHERYWSAEHRRPRIIGYATQERAIDVAPGVQAVKILVLEVYEQLGRRFERLTDVRFEVRRNGKAQKRYRTAEGLLRYLRRNGWKLPER